MSKEITYNEYQKQIKDKDVFVNAFVRRVLCMTSKMFEYSGLPDSIPQTEMERILQTNGVVGVAQVNGVLYALDGNTGGELDMYYRPTQYTVANPYLRLNKTYNIGDDIAIIRNTPNMDSLLPVIGKYAVLMCDGTITLNMASILSRITMLISASDDKTKESADSFVAKILQGDFSVIGENAFFKGVNLQTPPQGTSNQIGQLIELLQYYRATMLQDIGINANYNMKRERLNTAELETNVDVLLPYVDSMLQERVNGVNEINRLFGTDISVTLGSSWKLEHENYLSLLNGTENEHDHLPDEDMTETEETEETDGNDTETEETEETEETDGNDTETEETEETENEKEEENESK